MREKININKNWAFAKDSREIPSEMPKGWEQVDLPHTWNAKDGQDGGNDYFRGACVYAKRILRAELPAADRYYIELEGANSSAKLYVNGSFVAQHNGGYSTWRADITDYMDENTVVAVEVDNSPNETVYPQMADFTFYGGLYRDVNMIAVSNTHFDLDYHGAPGIQVTPVIQGENAAVNIKAYLTNIQDGDVLTVQINDADGNAVASASQPADQADVALQIDNVHLWNGKKDPYLYTAHAYIERGGGILDDVSARFGCRTFEIDPEKGFILNGKEYPLRGVSRHQDRWGIGNALLPEHHREDMELICELGATAVRLAHYQHAQYFYDLCDEKGIIVWAEIPYISKHTDQAYENTVSQMTELIAQNYNHPSVIVWGLSNEITMSPPDGDLLKNHRDLNELAHSMDKTRKTTAAIVSMCDIHDDYIQIPDTVAYNHYFGWYGGDTSMNGPWFDAFHRAFPDIPIGMSEYGCEALNWHTSKPTQGDYTEEYQAYYHEELIKQLYTRQYLWCTFVWNMFDFGADARNEGGENGQNHKGLVTFDRKYKKDAFYAYKAWLSDEPFVHICSKRYVNRAEDTAQIKVYSNQPEVELFANGESIGKKTAQDRFFCFEVPNKGETKLKAVAGACMDESVIRKVDTFDESYRLKEKGAVLNWFDITEPEGYFSLNDKVSDIMQNPQGAALFGDIMKKIAGGGENQFAGFEMNENMMKMMGGFTVLRLTNLMGTAGIKFTKEQLLSINSALNKLKKQ